MKNTFLQLLTFYSLITLYSSIVSAFTTYPKTETRLFLSEAESTAITKKWINIQTQNTNFKQNNPNITIVGLTTPERAIMTQYTYKSIYLYSQKWGYKYRQYKGIFNKERHINWSKLVAIQDTMNQTPESEWIAWFDDDILITNPNISLEMIISLVDNNKEFIISEDIDIDAGQPMNGGIFLIRNTKLMKKFLEDVWKFGQTKNYLFLPTLMEQQCITELIRDCSVYCDAKQILPVRILQSYLGHEHENFPKKVHWQKGDFAAHMNGIHTDTRMKILIPLLQQDDPFNLLHS